MLLVVGGLKAQPSPGWIIHTQASLLPLYNVLQCKCGFIRCCKSNSHSHSGFYHTGRLGPDPPRPIRFLEFSLLGTFTTWNFRSLEHSLPRANLPRNFHSLELSFSRVFAPISVNEMHCINVGNTHSKHSGKNTVPFSTCCC